jgi:multimeric flavodoxin WrbA
MARLSVIIRPGTTFHYRKNLRMIKIRKGQAPAQLSRIEFHDRFSQSFKDPMFAPEEAALARVEDVAWEAYKHSRKTPITEKAGKGYADPAYDLSVEWAGTSARLRKADIVRRKSTTRSRVLLIIGSARNDGTCPGEVSKTFRLAKIAGKVFEEARFDVDTLDLSLLTSEYGRKIHPCKGCVSTAMPLCHWPCSCYPNHSLGQTGDWMAEIYERWSAAHGVIILTPVYWYQVPATLKLMIDRMVCADGGNPDPTSTSGKNAAKAKALEMKGWPYPKHLAGRVYGLVVHGDVAGIEGVRRSLSDWLDWMGLIDAGSKSRLDRYIGYYEPYATSHDVLDRDKDMQEEVRNVARAVVTAVRESRAGKLSAPDAKLESPRPK